MPFLFSHQIGNGTDFESTNVFLRGPGNGQFIFANGRMSLSWNRFENSSQNLKMHMSLRYCIPHSSATTCQTGWSGSWRDVLGFFAQG